MKFLIISSPKHPIPPETMPGLLDAMEAWVRHYTASGTIETIWSNAGTPGGGGIANVDSPEELDACMAAYPFMAFSEVTIQPIVDLLDSLQRVRETAATAVAR